MKRLTILFILTVYLSQLSCTSKTNEQLAQSLLEQRLQNRLKEGEYFEVDRLLQKGGELISPSKKIYFSAFVASAFNRPQEAIRLINHLLKDRPSFVNDSVRVALLLLQRDNYVKTFQYAQAALREKELIRNYPTVLRKRMHEVQNSLLIHQALGQTPPQQVHLQLDSLPWKRNRLGQLVIPIQINHQRQEVIFDTRADLSTVTQSFARQIGLRLLPVSYQESSSSTGLTFRSQLGIADSLYLGHILIRHVVFQVLADELLYLAPIKFQIQAILGFPVITALQQVRFLKNGRLMIAEPSVQPPFHNLAFDGATPVVSLKCEEDTLSFHFDTGASSTDLYSPYFKRYHTRVLKQGTVKQLQLGGAGGITQRQVYSLPMLTLTIGSKKAILKKVNVHTMPINEGLNYYGNLGQDVMNQFAQMTLNFKAMYLSFE